MVYFPHFDHFGHLEGKFLQENHSFLDSGLIPTIFQYLGNFSIFTHFPSFPKILAVKRQRRAWALISRESLSQKSLSKRHVFSAIYLLFNRKTPKLPCIRDPSPAVRSRLCLNYRSKRHVFSAIYLLFNRKWGKNPCLSRVNRPKAQSAAHGAELHTECREGTRPP